MDEGNILSSVQVQDILRQFDDRFCLNSDELRPDATSDIRIIAKLAFSHLALAEKLAAAERDELKARVRELTHD